MAPKKANAASRSNSKTKVKATEHQPDNPATTAAEDSPKQEEPAAEELSRQNEVKVRDDAEMKDRAENKDDPELKKRKTVPDATALSANKDGTKESLPRKKQKTSTSSTPSAPTGSRKSSRNSAQAPLPSQLQLLNYLLSASSADLCRPVDETSALEENSSLTTYSSSLLSPFEELVCAVVLSRPISHRLGLRSIRTLLSPPYAFTTPKAIADAGRPKVLQAMHDARTQHKDKTAEQISLIAEVVIEKFAADSSDTSLEKFRESRHWDIERDLLQQSIKGLGKTGLDIFCRRTQWRFEEFFPFVDERTARGVEKLGLGLPKTAVELFKVLEGYWGQLDTEDIAGDDEETRKRRAFVIICERATGADLEGRSDEVLEAAAAAASS